MADFEPFRAETFAYFYVSSACAFSNHDIATFFQSLKRDKANTTILVGQVRPDDVVEYMLLDGIDCKW